MSGGFGAGDGKAKVFVQKEEVEKLIKQYKKLKKYMKSPLYEIKNLDGSETVVKDLLDQYGDDDGTQNSDIL
jgi:hypothetical protein